MEPTNPSYWNPLSFNRVATINDLSGLEIPLPIDGIVVFVETVGVPINGGAYYGLLLSSGQPIDGINVVGTFLGGAARWLRLAVLAVTQSAVPEANGMRLTLTSGVPVTTADVVGAQTVFLTPYISGTLSLYSAGAWVTHIGLTETSLPLGVLLSGKNYDVFAFWTGTGTGIGLEFSAAWASDTTRTDALARQDGILVKATDHTRRYMGTIRTTSTTTTEDSIANRFLWNQSNQALRKLKVIDGTASWTYSASAWRAARGQASNSFQYVTGDAASFMRVTTRGLIENSGSPEVAAVVGVGVDTSTANSSDMHGTNASVFATETTAFYEGYPGLGWHQIFWIESGTAGPTPTFYGAPVAADRFQSGMMGEFFA